MMPGRPRLSGGGSSSEAGMAADAVFARPPLARSPPPALAGPSFLFEGIGAMQAAAEDRSLPPTPRSPSPTCSPPGSPKRQRPDAASRSVGADSAAEDDLETRAAALGLNEVTQRVWKETALPPTPSSPSPTFSPPSSPKQRQAGELTAAAAAEKLAESLRSAREGRGGLDLGSTCGSDSEGGMPSVAEPGADAEMTAALTALGPSTSMERGPGPGSGRKKRAPPV
jgi:hypothetical protein